MLVFSYFREKNITGTNFRQLNKTSVPKNNRPVIGISFLSQEYYSCNKNKTAETRINFLAKEYIKNIN